MYIRHQPLFSFETLQEYQPKTRLGLLFETLDLHPCLKELPAKSIRGPKGYCGYAMLRALVAKQLFQIPTFTLLFIPIISIFLRYINLNTCKKTCTLQ